MSSAENARHRMEIERLRRELVDAAVEFISRYPQHAYTTIEMIHCKLAQGEHCGSQASHTRRRGGVNDDPDS